MTRVNGGAPQPPGQPPQPGQTGETPCDTGNSLLAASPARLLTTVITQGGQQLVMFTLRTPSTTLTVLLTRDDALTWSRQLATVAQQAGGLVIPTGLIP